MAAFSDVLVVRAVIPLIDMQSNLINKIPSYSVVWHKEYILSPSYDLVIGLNYI